MSLVLVSFIVFTCKYTLLHFYIPYLFLASVFIFLSQLNNVRTTKLFVLKVVLSKPHTCTYDITHAPSYVSMHQQTI